MPKKAAPKIEGLPDEMQLSAEDMTLLAQHETDAGVEGVETPSAPPTAGPGLPPASAAPEPEVPSPPAPTPPPPFPQLSETEEPEPEIEPPPQGFKAHEEFVTWLGSVGGALPEDARAKLAELHKAHVGIRADIARRNARVRETREDADGLRGQLSQKDAELTALKAILEHGRLPAAPVAPVAPKKLKIERDPETGELFIPEADARAMFAPPTPEPVVPIPGAPQTAPQGPNPSQDAAFLAAEHPSNIQVIQRLEAARQFIKNGISLASQKFGLPLQTEQQVKSIVDRFGFEAQAQAHWPDVQFEDLVDFAGGGRLMARVVRDYRGRWYPEAPQPSLDAPAAPRASVPAPQRNGGMLPLAGKGPTMTRRGGQAPEPSTAMNQLLDGAVDDLIKQNPEALKGLIDRAIAEHNSQPA